MAILSALWDSFTKERMEIGLQRHDSPAYLLTVSKIISKFEYQFKQHKSENPELYQDPKDRIVEMHITDLMLMVMELSDFRSFLEKAHFPFGLLSGCNCKPGEDKH